MKYQWLILIFLYFIPEKLCWQVERLMDIKIVSFSGNMKIENSLCKKNLSKSIDGSVDQDLTVVVCIKNVDFSNESQMVECRNSTLVIQEPNCVKKISDEFNEVFKQISFMKAKLKVDKEILILFQIQNGGRHFQTEYFQLKGLTTNPMNMSISIPMEDDIIFNATLSYSFRCTENFYGSDCQIFCKATDNDFNHFNCTESGQRICLPGFKGIFCSVAICNNCLNGQCVRPGICRCYRGWTGNNCDICLKAPGCINGKCQNYTTSSNSSKPQLKAFTCSCNPDWGGQNCDIDLKHCINHVGLCKNNGACHNYYGDHIKHYLCQCAPGYYGRHCEIKTGDCNHDKFSPKTYLTNNFTPTCRCYHGFSGSQCQINNALQFQIDSNKSYLRSDGHCVNLKEGYSCSCSDQFGGMCRCQFIKCLDSEICIDKNSPIIRCSNYKSNNSVIEFSSNFRFENSSYVIPLDTTKNYNQQPQEIFDFKYYFSSIIVVPLLLGILIVLAVKFRYKFRRKSRTSIKTIHNDLGLVNNQINNNPLIFTEQKFLLNQRSIPDKDRKCINNLVTTSEVIQKPNKSGDDKLLDKDDESTKTCDLSRHNVEEPIRNPVKNSVIHNPNLLINHYKNINENKI